MTKQIASAAEWRRRTQQRRVANAVTLTLPSGAIVKVSRPEISTWFGTAKLPEHLSAIVVDVFQSESPGVMQEKVQNLTEAEDAALLGFLNRLILEGVVEPQVVINALKIVLLTNMHCRTYHKKTEPSYSIQSFQASRPNLSPP